ncbi:hypothetical protein [Lysinibacillus sphaericus]|uniref:hypothetical protein n=1 Tax=Lysinibacillus sphaericus TaxID=1421 RepID=UPI001A9DCB31|nr:hypothetical protein [Lysinibacillus sphaericus]QTB25230.1 hypothetical protein J2D51_12740 [Lysinibacillus sphaericus]
MNLDEQIERENMCIEDLAIEIVMLARKGETDIAKQLKQDLHNSLEQLEKLHNRKELWSIASELNLQGKNAKVVRKVVEMA